MSILDAALVRRSLANGAAAELEHIDVFDSIDSTNSHLINQAPPAPGRLRAAIADHQTAGRGRHDRRWLSPRGSGLCLSVAYTFTAQPQQLPALTLAIGVGIVDALRSHDIRNVSLKWPNDLVAQDAKLGGVLTEVRPGDSESVTVVTGVGINILLPPEFDTGAEASWAQRPTDLNSVKRDHPAREALAGVLIGAIHGAMTTFETEGFSAFASDWRQHDWLRGKTITVDTANRKISGVAAGVDADGALLLEAPDGQVRVLSGSITVADGSL